ncbi:MAG: hypothetical protein JW791_03970 [Nanoarchaeota archaeon]|nr:hypothetical protein [Nanoarchaeota archaeon]
MRVTKRNGEVEEFDTSKVENSLRNSGVSEKTIETVINKILEKNYDLISTDRLYRLIYKLVKKYENKYAASIYSLKQSIMSLGPDGYAFEDFIAKILIQQGTLVETRQVYESMTIPHELDVVGSDFFIECKYHNSGGITTSIKDVLYSHARFLDLVEAGRKRKSNNFKQLWIATNTKFSDDCLKYADYWDIKMISWKHKGKDSLSYIVDKFHYYPVTLLPSVSKRTFSLLSKNNILLITEVIKVSDSLLRKIGLNNDEVRRIREDCDKIIKASEVIQK